VQEGGEARIRAEGVENWVYFEEDETGGAIIEAGLQTVEGLLLFAEGYMDGGDPKRLHVGLLGALAKLIEDFAGSGGIVGGRETATAAGFACSSCMTRFSRLSMRANSLSINSRFAGSGVWATTRSGMSNSRHNGRIPDFIVHPLQRATSGVAYPAGG
jgi:hypothetical protein